MSCVLTLATLDHSNLAFSSWKLLQEKGVSHTPKPQWRVSTGISLTEFVKLPAKNSSYGCAKAEAFDKCTKLEQNLL